MLQSVRHISRMKMKDALFVPPAGSVLAILIDTKKPAAAIRTQTKEAAA